MELGPYTIAADDGGHFEVTENGVYVVTRRTLERAEKDCARMMGGRAFKTGAACRAPYGVDAASWVAGWEDMQALAFDSRQFLFDPGLMHEPGEDGEGRYCVRKIDGDPSSELIASFSYCSAGRMEAQQRATLYLAGLWQGLRMVGISKF